MGKSDVTCGYGNTELKMQIWSSYAVSRVPEYSVLLKYVTYYL